MEDSIEYIDTMKDLLFCKGFVERSEIYRKLHSSLQDDRLLGKKVRNILASRHMKMKLVIYNIGSIQFTWPSKFRLALCLKFKETMPSIFDEIDILDPTLNCYEQLVLTNLRCNVFSRIEPCRKVLRPTMFFMPYSDPILFENLLEANWSASNLNQITVFGPSFLPMMRELELKVSKQRIRRLRAIKGEIMEFNLCKELKGIFEDGEVARRFTNMKDWAGQSYSESNPFEWMQYQEDINEHCPLLALHFFNLKEGFDLESLVPSKHPPVKEVKPEVKIFDAGRPANWYVDPRTLVLEKTDEQEAPRVKEELVTTMEEIRESEPYKRFNFAMSNDPVVNTNISRILSGSNKWLNLLIYGLKSLEVTYSSQYALAFALLLKKDSVFPISEIEIFDPWMTPVDIKVCIDFNIRVLSVDDRCRRVIERPTILFAPGLPDRLVGNMLESNFGKSHLNQMIFVGLSSSDTQESINDKFFERLRYLWTVERYISKQVDMNIFMPSSIVLLGGLKFNFYHAEDELFRRFLPYFNPVKCFFYHYVFDAYHQDQLMGIDNLRITQTENYNPNLERKFMSIRRPVSYIRRWQLPDKDSVKLNFHGYVDKRKALAGFGGAFHDEDGELLLSYSGPLNLGTDFNTASLESLKAGLKLIGIFNILQSRKLVIEGDALSTLRWTNKIFPPPERFSKVVGEIGDIIENIQIISFCTFFHLYREGNSMAMELARKGAELKGFFIWKNT